MHTHRFVFTLLLAAMLSACFEGPASFSRSFGGDGDDRANVAIATGDGGYAMAGQLDREDGGRLFVAKLNALGNPEWQVAFAPTLPETASDPVFARASDGTVCIAATVDSGEHDDVYLAKADSTGGLLWQYTLDSGPWSGYAYASDVPASDRAMSVLSGPLGGCFAGIVSRATLLDVQGIGFERLGVNTSGRGDALQARSTVVAHGNATGSWVRRLPTDLNWQARLYASAAGALVGTSQRTRPRLGIGPGDDETHLQLLSPGGDIVRTGRVNIDEVGRVAIEDETEGITDLFEAPDGSIVLLSGDTLLALSRFMEPIWRRDIEREPSYINGHVALQVGVGGPRGILFQGRTTTVFSLATGVVTFSDLQPDRVFSGLTSPWQDDDGTFVLRAGYPDGTTQVRLRIDAAVTEVERGDIRPPRPAALAASPQRPGAAEALIEVRPDVFWVAGTVNTAAGSRAVLAEFSSGQLRWQRELTSGGEAGRVTALLEDGTGGALAFLVDADARGHLVRLDAAGNLVASGDAVSMEETGTSMAIKAASTGYLVISSGARLGDDDLQGEIYLFDRGLAPAGAFEAPAFITLTDAAEVDGDIIAVGVPENWGDFALVWAGRVDAQNREIWSRNYRFYDAEATTARIAIAPDGDVLLALTSRNVLRQGFTPANADTTFGEHNVSLVRVDATNGVPRWLRVYGGLLDEALLSLRGLPDGGVLVGGRSDSFGVRSEAWLLRTQPDGTVSAGCNAYLGEVSGVHMTADNAGFPSGLRGATAATAAPADTTAIDLTATVPELIVARQCISPIRRGAGRDGTVPAQTLATLTVNQAGSTPGLVTSVPTGIFCGNAAAELCAATFATGTTVFVTVDDASAPNFRGWGANACEVITTNPHRCELAMADDRFLDVFFEPSTGETATLSLEVTGAGRVYASRPGGIDCGGPTTRDCEEAYLLGQQVYLDMVEDVGERFLGWGGDCAQWGTASGIVVSVDADVTCTALFSGEREPAVFTLETAVLLDGLNGGGEVASTPSGILCTPAGGSCAFDFDAGAVIELAALPRPSSNQFVGWTSTETGSPCDGATERRITLTMDQARRCDANFATPGAMATLTVNLLLDGAAPGSGGPFGGHVTSNPNGVFCGTNGNACSATFPVGTSTTLSARADAGFTFAGWSGDCAGGAQITFALTADMTCTAAFTTTPPPADPILDVIINGNGIVDTNPPGISLCSGVCSAPFTRNSTIQIAASPRIGSSFIGWSGDCSGSAFTTLLMDGNKQCTADFTPAPTNTFRLSINVVGNGAVDTADGLIRCPGDCDEDYVSGTRARVLVSPGAGATFLGWSGQCADLDTSTDFFVTMLADQACTATFSP